ncbi:hypothetical protein GC176_03195 [bacterium]|nr:hypothetical protein [bacterium]
MVGLLLSTLAGCAALRPMDGVPARYLPDDLRGRSREDAEMIDLSLLRRTEPAQHIVDSGDVLAVYIENVLGRREQPPINQALDDSRPPTLGYPVMVQDDGSLSLPLIPPIMARGKTIPQLQQELVSAYTIQRRLLPPGQERILVTLHRPRTHRILVVRQESQSDALSAVAIARGTLGSAKRGTGHVVTLPIYKNDVMNALVLSGGLPGLDARNVVYVIRGRKVQVAPVGGPMIRGQSPDPGYAPNPGLAPDFRYGAGPVSPQTLPPQTGALPGWQPLPNVAQPQPYLPPQPYQQPGPYQHPGPALQSMVQPPPGWQPPPIWNDVAGIVAGAYNDGSNVIRIPLRLPFGEAPQIAEHDVTLNDGDIVYIASRDNETFYTGGLLGGGEYTLPRDRDIDILEAIAISEQARMSQQTSGRSALNNDVTISPSQAIVLRRLPNNTQVPILVDIYRARRYPSERINILPGDYILLQYTKLEAVGAFIERHFLESALFGVAAAQVRRN